MYFMLDKEKTIIAALLVVAAFIIVYALYYKQQQNAMFKYVVFNNHSRLVGYTNDLTIKDGCMTTNNGKACGMLYTRLNN